jgi:hypothetical protein
VLATVTVGTGAAIADDEWQPGPPVRTPFDRGRVALSAGASSQTLFGSTYIEIGAGVGYYVLDGLAIGLSGIYEFGNGPSIAQVSPSLRYVAQPLVGKWPIVPYIGTFYKHWFIGGDYADEDTVGGSIGFMYVSGNVLLGLGLAVETEISACTMSCTWEYPDLTFSLAL